MIYTALCVMLLMRAASMHYLGKCEGVGPWKSGHFLAPNGIRLSARCHFTGPNPLPLALIMDAARIKSNRINPTVCAKIASMAPPVYIVLDAHLYVACM
jgi:hypothetical protein